MKVLFVFGEGGEEDVERIVSLREEGDDVGVVTRGSESGDESHETFHLVGHLGGIDAVEGAGEFGMLKGGVETSLNLGLGGDDGRGGLFAN